MRYQQILILRKILSMRANYCYNVIIRTVFLIEETEADVSPAVFLCFL